MNKNKKQTETSDLRGSSKVRPTAIAVAVGLVAVAGFACARISDEASPAVSVQMEAKEDSVKGTSANRAGGAAPAPSAAKPRMARKKMRAAPAELAAEADGDSFGSKDSKIALEEVADDVEGGGGGGAPTRAWFPETFLFEPALITDGNGNGHVTAVVPDRLTTWRVLALAHSRAGAQAGATTSFLGTLPVYVDPVVPAYLYAGDRVEVPLQVVNTTDKPIKTDLSVSAEGAQVSDGRTHTLLVTAQSDAIASATLLAKRPGEAALTVRAGRSDAVKKTIPVRPVGRRVVHNRGGTLAAPREVRLTAHAATDADSAKVRLTVYPGALSLLRNELANASSRGGVADDAYTLLLAGQAPALLAKLGESPDPEVLRKMRIVATQRVLRAARSPSLSTALLAAEAALSHADDPILGRLGERLVGQVQRSQRPDGTFGGETGWTLQRLLVTTAEAARVARATAPAADDSAAEGAAADPAQQASDRMARQRAVAVSLRANFAFERYISRVEDPYTAASILASGVVDGALADRLAKKVTDAVEKSSNGARYLPGGRRVRSDGVAPSQAEATAMAALALSGKYAPPWRADLGATLLAKYTPGRGWGDGRANLVCLRAVLDLFSAPVPEGVKVTLTFDGAPIADGTLDASKLRDTLVLSASVPRAAGRHVYGIQAEPAVAGLGYSIELTTWVPWETEKKGGLEVAAEFPGRLSVGQSAPVTIRATAPSRQGLSIVHGLPAGVQVETRSLDALVTAGTITRYETEEGQVTLHAGSRPNPLFVATYRVVPTLAGELRSGPLTLVPNGRASSALHVPPTRWNIRR